MDGTLAMARAFGGEPIVVRVVTVDPGGAWVTREDKDLPPVGWPMRDLYTYEQALYQRLRQTFVRGDDSALRVLWSEATHYEAKQGANAEAGQAKDESKKA